MHISKALILLTSILASLSLHSHKYKNYIDILTDILPENATIVEAGACDGTDTQIFAQTWPNATIYTFEPVPNLYAQLTEKIAQFPNVVPFNSALSSYTGTTELFVCTNNTGASSLLQPTALINHLHFNKPITIPCITLKKWADMHMVNNIDLLWLDCEGHELAILKAADNLIDHIHMIHIEVNFKEFRKNTALFNELKSWLEEHNFKEIWRSTQDTSWQANVIFLKTYPQINTRSKKESSTIHVRSPYKEAYIIEKVYEP